MNASESRTVHGAPAPSSEGARTDEAGGASWALREAQALVRFGLWQWDLATERLTWSDGLYQILGVSRDEAPSIDALLSRVHPEDQSAVRGYLARARRDGAEHAIEYRLVRPDGEHRVIQGHVRATLDDAGRPRHVIGTDQDITESKELIARVAFSDRMVSVGTLAGGVAHEINNPLAVISANLELIAQTHDSELTREALQNVDRIRTIVRGLTLFSRTDTDRRALLDLHRVLDLAIGITGNEIRHRARLVRHYGTLPMVEAHEARLGHVFINLLLNAAESIPVGHADRHAITVTTRADDAGWAVVEIRDTGAGIPPVIQGRIFDPFFTTKPVGKGTGLGLAICHGIVRSLGGEIAFRSEPDRGSVFGISLPPGAQSVPPLPRPVPLPEPPAQRGRMLLVDDEITFAGSLRRLFSGEHDVTVVGSGRHALDRLAAGERYDVILCDLMMPEISGVELHAALVRCAPDQADAMIFLTGGAFSPSAQLFLDSIPDRWFEKPCDLQELRAAVRRAIVRNRSR